MLSEKGPTALPDTGGFVLAPDAPGASLHPHSLALDHHGCPLDIGKPAGVGASLGVANVVAAAANLAAYLTTRHGLPFDGHMPHTYNFLITLAQLGHRGKQTETTRGRPAR